MKLPRMDLYWDDLLAGTAHLTLEELGSYIRLLGYQWSKGHLPTEPLVRMNLCGVKDVGSWERIWRHVSDKFEVDDEGLFRNPRMEEERVKALARATRSRENGKKGGRPPKPTGLIQDNLDETQTKRVQQPTTNNQQSTSVKRNQIEGGERTRARAVVDNPPTLDEVREYIEANGLDVDPAHFFDHCETNGWMRGRKLDKPIKNWKSHARQFERHGRRFSARDELLGKVTRYMVHPADRAEFDRYDGDDGAMLAAFKRLRPDPTYGEGRAAELHTKLNGGAA